MNSHVISTIAAMTSAISPILRAIRPCSKNLPAESSGQEFEFVQASFAGSHHAAQQAAQHD